MENLDKLPGNETVIIKVEAGYYSILNPINIYCGKHKIIISGSKNKPTVISGSIEVKEWQIDKCGLWKAKVPYVVNNVNFPDQLFVNGIRTPRAKTPNEGAFVLIDGIKDNSLYGAVLDSDDYKQIGTIDAQDLPILSIFWRWTVSKRHLIRHSANNGVLYYSGKDIPTERWNRIIIENIKSALDKPGEWCVDNKGYIYYMPRNNERLDKVEFRIPLVERMIVIDSKSNTDVAGLCFKNLIFEHSSYIVPTEGSSYRQSAAGMSAAIEVDNVKNLSFIDCEMRYLANYGIWLRNNCSESSIKNCSFCNLGAGAIKIGSINETLDDKVITNKIIIDNNTVCKYGELMESASGIILFNASDCRITHNDIHYGNYTGISMGWVWGYLESPSKRNEVAYNKISHIGTGLLCDLGGIYTLGRSEGTHIHNNYISYVTGPNSEAWGIYLDEGTTGVVVDKNIVSHCTSSFHQHYGSDNVVNNNIFAWGERSQIELSKVKEESPLVLSHNIIIMDNKTLMTGAAVMNSRFTFLKNCYWNVSGRETKIKDIDVSNWIQQKDSTSVYMNPDFVDPKREDYHLKGSRVYKTIGFQKFSYSKVGNRTKVHSCMNSL